MDIVKLSDRFYRNSKSLHEYYDSLYEDRQRIFKQNYSLRCSYQILEVLDQKFPNVFVPPTYPGAESSEVDRVAEREIVVPAWNYESPFLSYLKGKGLTRISYLPTKLLWESETQVTHPMRLRTDLELKEFLEKKSPGGWLSLTMERDYHSVYQSRKSSYCLPLKNDYILCEELYIYLCTNHEYDDCLDGVGQLRIIEKGPSVELSIEEPPEKEVKEENLLFNPPVNDKSISEEEQIDHDSSQDQKEVEEESEGGFESLEEEDLRVIDYNLIPKNAIIYDVHKNPGLEPSYTLEVKEKLEEEEQSSEEFGLSDVVKKAILEQSDRQRLAVLEYEEEKRVREQASEEEEFFDAWADLEQQ